MGLVAVAILFIINRDVLWEKSSFPANTEYRLFLFGVAIFFALDALWGFIDAHCIGVRCCLPKQRRFL